MINKDKIYLVNILDSVNKIQKYLKGITFDDFHSCLTLE